MINPQKASPQEHYLRDELYALVREDPAVFDFLQSGSLDGIWYWDLEHPEHEWISKRFWEVFGYDPKTRPHLASSWQDIIHPEDLKVAIKNFERHCKDPSHPYDQIVRYRHSNGSTVWVRCRGIAIRDADGTPRRMLGAHSDVTALKLAEARLEARNREISSANEDLAQFAYAASHDLRAPLNSLEGLLTIFEEDHLHEVGEDGRALFGRISKLSKRLGELSDAVLSLARVTSVSPDFELVDTAAAVQDVIDSLDDRIQRTGAHITCERLPVIRANPGMFRQLIQNLLDNALKFHRPDIAPVISLSASGQGTAAVFEISDNGIGMEEHQASTIFNFFSRLHTRSEYEGVGLGLSLCRKIVELHGGVIWVNSVPDQGSRFFFTINPSISRSES